MPKLKRRNEQRADGSLKTYATELPEWLLGAFDVVLELEPTDPRADIVTNQEPGR